jgi:hypothetical protein
MKRIVKFLLVSILLAGPITAQKIEGVWALTEVTTTGANGKTQQVSQPSMYLFTKKHYSIIYVAGDAPRPDVADIDAATADELRNIFVRSFIANAGTYEIKGGKLTTRPMVAKSPNFMKSGTWVTSAVTINANTMTLVTESNNAGPAANPTTFKLKRIE